MQGDQVVVLDGNSLTIENVVKVAREGWKVAIAEQNRLEVQKVRQYIETHWTKDDAPPIYGFNTGVGKLKDMHISQEQNDLFQTNIILSHCGGVGEPASEEVVRATMLVRLNSCVQGASGLRMEVLDRLLAMLNRGVHPVVPILGSVGASGDLGPLSYIMAVLIGHHEAEALYKGKVMSAPEALAAAGIEPQVFQLKAKDALALVNGTTMFAAYAALNCYDAVSLAKQADVLCALSLEAMRGELGAFDPRIHIARRHRGQICCAENVRRLTENSTRVTVEARKVRLKYDALNPVYRPRIQDNYSLRCAPQVHGAVHDNLEYIYSTIELELNAVTDNPLVFWGENGQLDALGGGNFHGAPVGFAMDLLAVSMTDLGNISERRIFTLCDSNISYGLPPMLAGEPPGLNCGYSVISGAAAALTSENKTLSFPASADNVPTKSSQEDHVSMAPWATRKAHAVMKNLEKIFGIETLLAAQAISITEEHLGQFKLGKGTDAVFKEIRKVTPGTKKDEYVHKQAAPCVKLVEGRKLLKAAEAAVGPLK